METFLTNHGLDLLTTLLGLAYILFEYRASRWMWAVGALMQSLGIVLYYQKGLYADCGMEFYYLAMTLYGYLCWTRRSKNAHSSADDHTPITHIPPRKALLMAGIALAAWAVIYYLLTHYTDSQVALADAFTTAVSIVGIWALAHKHLEQWFVWIVVDVVTCALYWYKDLPFKASLYALYVLIAIMGYRNWRRKMHTQMQA